ncbi:MAG TPA: molybdopterin dinucleotide binding domain-containing protein, partial [Methanoculleus sp.]|nr:molybdopterin dinucleotide binding domain-containing protein [Methanoculleus sp.]
MNFLITSGRTIAQGNELYYKDRENYSVETGRCFVNPFDLLELDAVAGDSILLSTGTGEEVFTATPCEDVASGTIFLPCGPHANAILHAATRG